MGPNRFRSFFFPVILRTRPEIISELFHPKRNVGPNRFRSFFFPVILRTRPEIISELFHPKRNVGPNRFCPFFFPVFLRTRPDHFNPPEVGGDSEDAFGNPGHFRSAPGGDRRCRRQRRRHIRQKKQIFPAEDQVIAVERG